MTTIFFYVLLFQIKDWDKICEEEYNRQNEMRAV